MQYPLFPFVDLCPHWSSKIISERNLSFEEDINLNGVRDFFDGIIKQSIKITAENCYTILKLGQQCGSQEIVDDAQAFINKSQRTIPELLNELIEENLAEEQNTNINNNEIKIDQHAKEVYLSKHYNEILQYPEILEKMGIPQHFRIVQQSLSHYTKEEFNYRGFISFVLKLIEKGFDRKYTVLLSLLEFDDFDLSEIERLCKCPNFDESFLNFKVVNNISKMKENNEKMVQQEENIRNLQNQINEFKSQNKQIFDAITTKMIDLFTNQQKSIDELKQQNKELIDVKMTSFNSDLKKEIENYKSEIKSQSKQLIDDQTSKIEQIFTSINSSKQQIDQKIDSLKNDIFEKFENSQNQIIKQDDEIKKQTIQLINTQTSKIEQLFTDQQNSLNEIKLQCKQNVDDQLSKITTIQNKTNSELNEIQTKISNLTSFIDENRGMKNDIIRIENAEKSNQSSQIQKLIEIQNLQQIIKKEIEQIDLYDSGNDLRRDYLGFPFSGIISELTKNHGGNINDKGIIAISGNSYNSSYSFLVNYNDHASRCLNNVQNSYICFDFKDHCISLSAYSIQSSSQSTPDYLKSWKIEGSNGENEWIELDSHSNDFSLCSHSVIRTFQICSDKKIKQPFKFIRIRMTGPNSRNFHNIEIANVEFFGKYYKL